MGEEKREKETMGLMSGSRRWRLLQKKIDLDIPSSQVQVDMSQQQQPHPRIGEEGREHGHHAPSDTPSLGQISSICTQQAPVSSTEYDAEGAIDPDADIERLGRQRPSVFRNFASEAAFCFSIVMSQVLTVRSYTILP